MPKSVTVPFLLSLKGLAREGFEKQNKKKKMDEMEYASTFENIKRPLFTFPRKDNYSIFKVRDKKAKHFFSLIYDH